MSTENIPTEPTPPEALTADPALDRSGAPREAPELDSDGREVQRTSGGIRINDRRRISREEAEAPVDAVLQPKRVKKFFEPPASVKGLIIPVSAEVGFTKEKGFECPCSKGWARAAATKLRAFRYALGFFQGQYGAVAHVLTFDRATDKDVKNGYTNTDPAHVLPPAQISMQGDQERLLSYHVLSLPVRPMDADPYDLEQIAASMRRLKHLLDNVPSLKRYDKPGSFWLPVLRDKNTSWEKLSAAVTPYLDPRITLVEESLAEA